MTVPSIKFVCPKCGAVKIGICETQQEYCDYCPGSGQTKRGWEFHGPVSKVRTRNISTKTRMRRVDEED